MGELIDDLLKFSRLGRSAIKIEPVALETVLKTAMGTLAESIKRVKAQVHAPEQMPAINGDVNLVTHVFINLLENALKYHKPDVPPVIDIRVDIEDPYAVISIADNGIGIDPAYYEKIFNIFQRLHSEADYPGTGIGLAAVRKAVQIMGGKIRVESELDKGSVFKIKLLLTETS
jgi:signal transduction histidine kinase